MSDDHKFYVGGAVNPNYRNLPPEYTQVEYIQNDMVGCIYTGVSARNSMKVVADFQIVEKKYGYGFNIFGVGDTNDTMFKATISSTNTFITTNTNWSQTSNLYARTTVTATAQSGYYTDDTIQIFGKNSLTYDYGQSAIVKLYSLKIYYADRLLRDFVPCFRVEDNVVGLYDLVNNYFISPHNSLDLKNYERLEYLESTGTQWIDSEYVPNDNTGFYARFITNNDVGSDGDTGEIFGTCDANYKGGYYLETWGDGFQGQFERSDTVYDSLITKGDFMSIVHSRVTNTLERTDKTRVSTNTNTISLTTPMYIFARNIDGNVEGESKTRLYNLIFFENNKERCNFVPVRRKSDGMLGLYDTIGFGSRFITNSGTGEFIAGGLTQGFKCGKIIDKYVAREVKNVYVSVNNFAKRIQKIYTGVNGVAKLVYSQELTSIPIMTSDLTPWGFVSGSTTYSSQSPYKACDGSSSTYWCTKNLSGDSVANRYLMFVFPFPIIPVEGYVKSYSRGSYHQFEILGSLTQDNGTWDKLYEHTSTSQFDGKFDINTVKRYAAFKYHSLYTSAGTARIGCYVFNIWGYRCD